VSRIIILRRTCEKLHKIREFEPTPVGCYVFVASGVSRIICLGQAFAKLRQTREFEPTHVGCYVMIDELDAALNLQAFPRVRWTLKLMDSDAAAGI